MSLVQAAADFLATMGPADPRRELLERVIKNPKPPPIKPEMPTFDRKRREFHQLMPAYLIFVEEIGLWEHYNRSETHDWMMANYSRLFPSLRRCRADEVPSDRLRQSVMISQLLDLAEVRRTEISDRERASVRHINPAYEYQGLAR
jgi:hypothetical protein